MPRRKRDPFGTNWMTFFAPVQENDPWDNRFTLIQYGPEELGGRYELEVRHGPDAFARSHPELFGTGTTSLPEGWFFWGLLKRRGNPGLEGGWRYQSKVRPGGKVGGATVDFVIASTPRDIACRIITPFFHAAAGPEKEGSDFEQLYFLQDQGYDVIDAPSALYMSDETGGAVLEMVDRVLRKDPSLMPGNATYVGVFDA